MATSVPLTRRRRVNAFPGLKQMTFCQLPKISFRKSDRRKMRDGRWPLTDVEKEVLWRFGFAEEFSSMFAPVEEKPLEGDLFG